MVVNDILSLVDELKPNQYDDFVKMGWVETLDRRIYNDIVKTHYSDYVIPEAYDMQTELIAEDEYCDVYKHYVIAMIDYHNNETDRYMNSMQMFNASYKDFADHYNRTHRPHCTFLDI